jgi:hypothetical protein
VQKKVPQARRQELLQLVADHLGITPEEADCAEVLSGVADKEPRQQVQAWYAACS